MPGDSKQANVNLRFDADVAKRVDALVAECGLNPLRWRQEVIRKAIEAGLPLVEANLRKAFVRKSA